MLVKHREGGGQREARHRLGVAPPKASSLPNGVFLGPPGSFDYAV